jgi:NADPH:quinone reductase-like Zn-dependent oxidoreductase
MARAVRFNEYGGLDVLEVVDVPQPEAGEGRVVVRVAAAAINPGERAIREGYMHERFPATFPSGQGTDFAGVVESVGSGVSQWSPGDEVIGWTHERASHAGYVQVAADHLVAKPAGVSWEAAGSLGVAGTTAVACVEAVAPRAGETVAVSGAAGGVGSIVVQLARGTGVRVLGIASERHHGWLRAHDTEPVAYGDRLADRLRELTGGAPDAFIDCVGGGYVALAVSLGVATDRINTIIDFAAAAEHGVKTMGSVDGTSPETLAELARLIDRGDLEIPIAATYPLERVRDAFTELSRGHVRGKIVLVP